MEAESLRERIEIVDDEQTSEADALNGTNEHINDGGRGSKNKMLYRVTDVPPLHLCILLGLQQCFMTLSSCFGFPLLLASHVCMTGDPVGISELVGTMTFISGVGTLLQTCVGIRLPIVQGPSAAFIAPIISLMSLPEWRCPRNSSSGNHTLLELENDEHNAGWKLRLSEVQGDIMVASIFQIVIGFSGLIPLMMKFIGPLTVASTISVIGLSLLEHAMNLSASHWWIALLTTVLIVVFSQYLAGKQVPCISWNRRDGFFRVGLPIFTLFPVLFALVISWILCFILTETGVFPNDEGRWGYRARTDIKADVLLKAEWFRFPYPGQWGTPTVSMVGSLGMTWGALASMIESVGDYYACARLAGAPSPPGSAVGRGIFMEGIGSLLAGAWGTGMGTTSYSENIGAIGITKVGSRVVVMVTGVFLMTLGCLGKVGALFVTMPDPVIGGMFIVMFGMVTGAGISNLHFVDLTSVRNLLVLGVSLFLGLGIPRWVNANTDKIETGSEIADQMICVLLGTSMAVAGLTAALLDNTIPGTNEGRGITKWRQKTSSDGKERKKIQIREVYDLPFIQKYLNTLACTRYVPILPSFILDKKQDTCYIA